MTHITVEVDDQVSQLLIKSDMPPQPLRMSSRAIPQTFVLSWDLPRHTRGGGGSVAVLHYARPEDKHNSIGICLRLRVEGILSEWLPCRLSPVYVAGARIGDMPGQIVTETSCLQDQPYREGYQEHALLWNYGRNEPPRLQPSRRPSRDGPQEFAAALRRN